MGDPFGFGENLLAVTTRPVSDPREFTSSDTFATDCSTATSNDGTEISAEWANEVVGNLRALLRANGTLGSGALVVAEDHSDGMLTNSVISMIQRNKFRSAIDTGSANVLTFSLSPAPAEFVTGMVVYVKKGAAANTAAMTVVANSQAAAALVWADGSALINNDWPANSWARISYDATNPSAPFWVYGGVLGPSVFQRVGNFPNRFAAPSGAAHTVLPSEAGTFFDSSDYTSATQTYTLPLPSSVPVGTCYGFINDSGLHPLTVNVNGGSGEVVVIPGVQSITSVSCYSSGSFVILQTDGTNWIPVSASIDVGWRFLGRLLAANGYTSLPDQTIFQWGVTSPCGPGASTLAFNVAFPNAVFGVFTNANDNSTGTTITGKYTYKSLSQWYLTNPSSATVPFYWFAIGY